MRMTVEEGIADGVDEVRKAVRYQITHGAKLIKCCASGGVMTPTGPPGAQQYSTEELAAIADEAHRRGLRVATHAHGDTAVNAALDAGIDCIEHGMMISDDTIQRMVDTGTFLVSTCALTENWDISDQPKALQAKAAEVFPKAKESLSKAIEAGVKVALGTDAPAIFHGRNAEELEVLVHARHDADPGDPLRDDRRRRPHRPPRPRSDRPGDARRHHRRAPATRSPTSRRSSGCRS